MIVGIDLGTTNSAVAVWRDGSAELIPNSLGHLLTPSAVSVDDHGEVLVGLAARERQSSHPDRTATAFKRYMGTSRSTKLGKRTFSPEELSALVLRRLKGDAEAYLGVPVERAVITVPAYFNDKQRKATERAGQLAGIRVERLVNEPTAAALAYSIHQREEDARFLVFDLGGGTFDVSIVEIFEGIIEVRASTGDNKLGGEDFNDLLAGAMRERFAEQWGEKGRGEDALHQKLREAAERARRELSSSAEATMRVVWEGEQFALSVTAQDFEERAAPLIVRLRDPVLRSLRDSNISTDSLTEVILIGGATRMPIVRRAVARMFGRFPNTTVNPDEAVALGAAIQAGLKARDQALKEVVVTDVCPFSLGIETARQLPGGGIEDGVFSPIIERSTVIPASRVETFSSMHDNQPQVDLVIYQGEARRVSDNVEIGRTQVRLPRGPAGQLIDVRFSYDVSGLLEVDVLVPKTGETVRLVINDGTVQDPKALEKAQADLAALKVHPRDQEENRAALARGEKCFENALGTDRQHISELIGQFQAALHTQDPRMIGQARKEFHDALDRFEGQLFL